MQKLLERDNGTGRFCKIIKIQFLFEAKISFRVEDIHQTISAGDVINEQQKLR